MHTDMEQVLEDLGEIKGRLRVIHEIERRLSSIDTHLGQLNGKVADIMIWRSAVQVTLPELKKDLDKLAAIADAQQATIDHASGKKLAVKEIATYIAAICATLGGAAQILVSFHVIGK